MNMREESKITWQMIASVLALVLWAILFAMSCWLVSSVGELKTEMAVVNNVLHISRTKPPESIYEVLK